MTNPEDTYILDIYYLVWFGLVCFYGILTIVNYLMLNPVYTYTIFSEQFRNDHIQHNTGLRFQ